MNFLGTNHDRAITILVIDSSPNSAENYQRLLQQDTKISYQFLTEGYNSQLLALYQSDAVDVILLESNQGDPRSFEVLEKLKAQIGEHYPPIILIDNNDAELAVRGLKAGAVDYLIRDQITANKLTQALCRAVTLPTEATSLPLDKLLGESISSFCQREEHLRGAAKIDAFRVTLSDALRSIGDPIEVQATACRLLGEELEATRVYYYEYNEDAGYGVVHHDYAQDGESSISGVYWFKDFSSIHTMMRAGRPVIIADIASSNFLTLKERAGFETLDMRALVGIPLVKNGRLVAVFNISQSSIQNWLPLEIELMQETAERTWAAVERARAETALSKSEEKYRTLFNSIDEGYFLVDVLFDENNQPIDLFYLEANPAAIKLMGKDFTGKQLSGIKPNYESYWYEIFGRVVRTGKGERLEKYAEPDQKWYDFYTFRVGDKDSHSVAVIFQDITKRKRQEANAEFLANLARDFSYLSSADEILHTVGTKVGAYLHLSNCFFAEINEAQTQAIIKYNWHTPDMPDMTGVYRLSEFVTEEFQQAAQAGEIMTLRKTHTDPRTNKDGTQTNAPINKDYYAKFGIGAFVTVPFHHEDKWKYLFNFSASVAHDWRKDEIELICKVTNRCFLRLERAYAEAERQKLLEREKLAREEAERANRIKDEFLSILSHELRTPLNPILGWSKLLQTRNFEPTKMAQALATIERNARTQAQLIDELLDVAKILRGKLSLNPTTVNLASVIDAAIETVKTAATAKSISLRADLLPIFLNVSGDPVRLQQIVWNLLSNAVKFTSEGGQVDICLEQVGNQAQIMVRDMGKGICADFLPHIFESFTQQDASITRQFAGLGLGLAIVRYLVEAHGGTVTADSLGEGQGATFTVRLPLLKVEPQSSLTENLLESKLDLAGIRVLAVDDEADDRELLKAVLTAYGAEVRVAASASEALEIFVSFQADVLVSDIGMPEVDGYTLIERIRVLIPEPGKETDTMRRLNLSAIALTAYAREEDRQRALESGYQIHIAKPLEPEKLVQAVAELAPRH